MTIYVLQQNFDIFLVQTKKFVILNVFQMFQFAYSMIIVQRFIGRTRVLGSGVRRSSKFD